MSLRRVVRDYVHANKVLLSAWQNLQSAKNRVRYLKDYGVWDWWFDTTNGIDSAGFLMADTLTVLGPHGPEATGYLPVRPPIFLHALSSLGIDHSNYIFVDIGSGKGRAVLLASNYPFKKAIGVEFARELYETALKNAQKWKHSQCPVEFVWSDALDFQLPTEPSVLFIYQPFAAAILLGLLENVRRSIEAYPRDVILMYVNPEDEEVIRTCFPHAKCIADFTRKFRYVAYRLESEEASLRRDPAKQR